ncbi:hypothetical protein [Rhodococcus sp. RD6.2]|uniref:hypothetical protein n=1 Tax=Rhodococcus sp. RD6.2 TaxID=260936 RepID=UPI000678F47D|nr:hypothetical protein [Rhodococcus sp. RD6.2]
MSSRSARRTLSTVVVATALGGALVGGGGSAMAGSLDWTETPSAGSEAGSVLLEGADPVKALSTIVAPVVDVVGPVFISVCAAVRYLQSGENYCIFPPGPIG